MPLGIDVNRYRPAVEPMNFGFGLKKFVFLSIFRWSYRKGHDLLIRAFLEEFSSDDDVSLLLVSRAVECPEELGPQKIAEDFKALRSTVNKPDSALPHIALYGEPIPERRMPSVYAVGDVFALMSRGEGFGLPYAEAGACAVPILATNCSGHSDFLDEETATLIEPDGYVTAETNGAMNRMAKLCHFYQGQKFPDFGPTAFASLKSKMRGMYEDPRPLMRKALALRERVVDHYTWDAAVDRVHKRIIEIQ